MTRITKNKTVRRMICGLLIVALAGGGIFYGLQSRQPEENTLAREQTVTPGDIVSSLTEEGTASVATQTTGLDLDVTLDDDTRLDLEVKVDDVLVRAGETVTEGTPLFVLDQTSLNKAMNTLDNAYQQAQLKADDASLELTLGTVDAEQARIKSVDTGSTASGVYENTLTEMENKMKEYEKNLQEGQEDYEKYSKLLELYNLRTATRNNMQSLVTYYEDALEALQEFYDDYNEDNADYKTSYNNYQKQLESLTEALEKAEAEKDAYADSEDAAKYGDAYNTAVDNLDKAIEIINKYQSVVDEYDTLENRIADAEDCLEEAKEAYDEYNEDYQEWYGNTTYSELQRKVSQLQLDQENTQLTYENYKLLYESNKDIAESEKNKSAVSAETADLTYASTVNKLQQEVLSTQLTAQNLADYVAELNSCLQDNVILAPCDGLVTNIGFETGDEINLTEDVVTIAQSDSVAISLSIDQDDITSVSLDQEALVTFESTEDTVTGKVDAISVSPMSIGAPTVNYTVTVTVEGDGLEDIYEGMSCTVELVQERVEDVLIVPKRAITTEGDKNYVTVKQEDGTGLKQEVTLGFTDGSSYEVVSGLEEGDIVLIESQINHSADSNTAQSAQNGLIGTMPEGETMPDMENRNGAGRPDGGEGGMPSDAAGNP